MSRVAAKGNAFGLGHNAAAVISSAFFCREQRLGADTQKEILTFLEARLLKNPIYAAPRPNEAGPLMSAARRRPEVTGREVKPTRLTQNGY